jgi:hypothetical protein
MEYLEIKNRHPEMIECFFAFSTEQFNEGKKNIPEGKKILSATMGLYGTREGITKLLAFYDANTAEIGQKCDPQEVYDFEFDNHECSYTCDDTEVIKLIISYFGEEKAATVKRRHAFSKVADIKF